MMIKIKKNEKIGVGGVFFHLRGVCDCVGPVKAFRPSKNMDGSETRLSAIP